MLSQKAAISKLLRENEWKRVSVKKIMRPFEDQPFRMVLCHTARVSEIRKELEAPYRLEEWEYKRWWSRITFYNLTSEIWNLPPLPLH